MMNWTINNNKLMPSTVRMTWCLYISIHEIHTIQNILYMRETQNRPDLDWNENKRKNKIIWLSNCLHKDMEKWIFIKLVLFEMKFIYCVYMLDVCLVLRPILLFSVHIEPLFLAFNSDCLVRLYALSFRI